MPYQVPQNIDPNKIFFVNFSEIEGRLDAEFYKPSVADTEKQIRKIATKRLKDFCLYVAGGATPKTDKEDEYYSDECNGIPFLRVQNLQTSGEITLENVKYVNQQTHNGLLKRSQISSGDLLVKITGVGRMAIASVVPDGFIGNINQHMVVIKTRDKTISEYLAKYFNLNIIEKIASRHSTGGTRPALDYPSLLNIPIIENIDFSLIENALLEKYKKHQQAETLLQSIDNYLLEGLGITLPDTKAQSLNDRIFTVNYSEVCGGRLDPKGVLLLGEHAKSTKYSNIQLKQIATIKKGEAITSENVDKNGSYPVIAGGQTSPYNHNVYNYDNDVITVSASGAYSGYVWYHDYPIFASDCSVIYSKDDGFITKYIFEVLKAQQSQIYLLQQGAGQPHVYPDDLGKLWIPIIDKTQQIEIANHITEIRKQAKQLQDEGAEILRKAKEEVERMILE